MAKNTSTFTAAQEKELLSILQSRFDNNMKRHQGLSWDPVETKLKAQKGKLKSLHAMEATGGEPDMIGLDKKTGEYLYCDCSVESPSGRRSLCYDLAALDSRKEHKPEYSAVEMAADMGIELLNEEQYRALQVLGSFDMKTSSWIKTPTDIRKLDGAIFGDCRYGKVFVYHNGAASYYAARGFRGLLRV